MAKCFLGGTCNDSDWRERLIPLLTIDYFNPVVEDWTPECQEEELRQREACDFCLYLITPNMVGVYSIAEVTDDSNKRPDKTVFAYLIGDLFKTINEPDRLNEVKINSFDKKMIKSLEATGDPVERNHGTYIRNRNDDVKVFDDLAFWLNN